ncbi:hypothetical protein BV898_13571 [Hypsibius exemplaris]|uniref:Major facilitator superfamily associated domain-containing protein n=1 Tax=Hypsibius exemplaris TaxID=2072580 RepID=A0A1W0WAC4_HYPEX|nr:hypothetical protein BV898_13571 [Hypsibius exemplaris]
MTLKECLHVNKPLIPLKFLMFLIHGGIAALLPYMTIHMKDLGISASETSLILTVLPFVSAIGPPIGGALADKIGNYRIVFATATVLSCGLHLFLFFAVPVTPAATFSPISTPFNSTSIDFRCNVAAGQDPILLGLPASMCGPSIPSHVSSPEQSSMTITSCRVLPQSDEEVDLCGTSSIVSPSGKSLSLSEAFNLTQALCGKLKTNVAASSPNVAASSPVSCLLRCEVTRGSSWTCNVRNGNGTADGEQSHATKLAIYAALRLISTTVMWIAVPMVDALSVVMCKQYNGELGQQRMFSQIGFSIIPPVSGALMALATIHSGFPDYGPAFYIQTAMHALAALLIFATKVDARLPAANLAKDMKKVLGDRRVISMAFAVLACGCAFGFNTSFLFWFMEADLHASKVMLGLSQTVGGVFGIFAMAFVGPVIRKVGHTRILALGILLYSPRFLAMSYVPDGQAYWICVIQVLEALSHSLMIVAASDYSGKLSPKYVASLQGIVFAAHYCFGKGIGSLIGGQLLSAFGARNAFRSFAVAYAVLFIFYVLADYFFVVRYRRRNQDIKNALEGHPSRPSEDDLDVSAPLNGALPTIPEIDDGDKEKFSEDAEQEYKPTYSEDEDEDEDFDRKLRPKDGDAGSSHVYQRAGSDDNGHVTRRSGAPVSSSK